MDPLTIAAITAGIRGLVNLVVELRNKNLLTAEEAKGIMDAADERWKAAVAGWDALAPKKP